MTLVPEDARTTDLLLCGVSLVTGRGLTLRAKNSSSLFWSLVS